MKKRSTVESVIQKGIIKFRDEAHPYYIGLEWLHAIPNGGARDVISAKILKDEGVTPGVWDLSLPVPIFQDPFAYHGLYMEVKRPAGPWGKKGYLSLAQKKFGRWANRVGYAIFVPYSTQEGIDAIMRYLSGNWVQPQYSWMK